MKLAIGTANFQNKYGLLGTSIAGKKKIIEIKKELKKNNISFLDTSFEYNNLECSGIRSTSSNGRLFSILSFTIILGFDVH